MYGCVRGSVRSNADQLHVCHRPRMYHQFSRMGSPESGPTIACRKWSSPGNERRHHIVLVELVKQIPKYLDVSCYIFPLGCSGRHIPTVRRAIGEAPRHAPGLSKCSRDDEKQYAEDLQSHANLITEEAPCGPAATLPRQVVRVASPHPPPLTRRSLVRSPSEQLVCPSLRSFVRCLDYRWGESGQEAQTRS